MVETKICIDCKKEKNIDQFYHRKESLLGKVFIEITLKKT